MHPLELNKSDLFPKKSVTERHKVEASGKRKITELDRPVKKMKTGNKEAPVGTAAWLIGFKNLGNSCYVSAVLQALVGLPGLMAEATAVNIDWTGSSSSSIDQLCLVSIFVNLARVLKMGQAEQANKLVKDLKMYLGRLDRRFSGNNMEDASEFLWRLLEEMKNGERMSSTGTNFVDSNFMFEREETYTCDNCGETNSHIHCDMNMFCHLNGQVGGSKSYSSVSLQSLVTASLQDEKRERRCSVCRGDTATVCHRLVSLPRVLLVCIKRFTYNPALTSKDSRFVDIPESISLSEHLGGDARLSHPTNSTSTREDYRLTSVVSHHGSASSSGHYVADVARLDMGGAWFNYNDSVVSPTDEEEVRFGVTRSSGYLFFFCNKHMWEAYVEK